MTMRTGGRPLVLGALLMLGAGVPGGSLAAPKVGSAAAAKAPAITGIELKVYDRQKNAVVPVEEASDPYGMNVDAVLVVRIEGTYSGDASLALKLIATAPREFSEATGELSGWKVVQARKLPVLSENGVTFVPFLIPYECASKVKVTTTLTGPGVKSSKTLDTAFACAE